MLCHCLVNCFGSFCEICQFIAFTQLNVVFEYSFAKIFRRHFVSALFIKIKICILPVQIGIFISRKTRSFLYWNVLNLQKPLNRVSSIVTTWCSFCGNCFDRSLKPFECSELEHLDLFLYEKCIEISSFHIFQSNWEIFPS